MAAIQPMTTGPRPSTSAPCHPIISRQIDLVICKLDAETRPRRRRLLQLEKLIIELAIPSFYPNGGARP
jgi:hypothetical protein